MLMFRYQIFAALLVAALVAGGCGESHLTPLEEEGDGNDAPVTSEVARDYIMSQETVVMPWTREVSGDLIDQVEVEADKLRFPVAGNEDTVGEYEWGDVLVSADFEKPFLRKITDVEIVDDEYVIHTRQAKLGEAVYRGSMNTAEQTAGQRVQPITQDGIQTRHQYIEPDKEDFGDGVASESDPNANLTPGFPVDVSMSPSASVTPSFYFDLKIDPGDSTSVSHSHFYSPHQRCPNGDRSYCDPEVGTSYMDYESYCEDYEGEWNVCQFRQDVSHASCDSVVASLNYAEDNPECKALFDKFYDGELGIDAYKSSNWAWTACDHWGPGYWRPPHPVHIDWAKEHCEGAVKRVVVDAQVSAEASTGDIEMTAADWSSSDSYTIWQSKDKLLTRKVFFIGWLPVLITSNASLRVEAEYEASFEASLTFEGISLTGLVFGGGFAKYAHEDYEDNKGVDVHGQFELFSQGIYGDEWHETPPRTPQPQLTGLELRNKEVLTTVEGSLSAKLSVIPRIDLLLYNLAGPYVEPLIPYGEVHLSAGGTVSNIDGVQSSGGTCSNSLASACARVGAEGRIGITAENICDGCDWGTSLGYNTCSDFCPANEEFLCGKWCLGEDGTDPDPDPDPEGPKYVHLEVTSRIDNPGTNDPSGLELDTLVVWRDSEQRAILPVDVYNPGQSSSFRNADHLQPNGDEPNVFECAVNWHPKADDAGCNDCTSDELQAGECVQRADDSVACSASDDALSDCFGPYQKEKCHGRTHQCWDNTGEGGEYNECGRYYFPIEPDLQRFNQNIVVEFAEPIKNGDLILWSRPGGSGDFVGGPDDTTAEPVAPAVCKSSGRFKVGLATSSVSGAAASDFVYDNPDTNQGFGQRQEHYLNVVHCSGNTPDTGKICLPSQ